MDRQTRIEYLTDHFQNPRNKGTLEKPEVSMPGGNPGCGDVVKMHLRSDPAGESIEALSWEGDGCTISMAGASILSEWVRRKDPTLEQILAFDYEEMIDLLGRDVVSSRPKCATLALGTLKAAVRRLALQRRLAESEEVAPPAPSAEAESGLVFGDGAVAAAGQVGPEEPGPAEI